MALLLAWVVAILVYSFAIGSHGAGDSGRAQRTVHLTGTEFGATLLILGAAQVWWFVVWRGWPFADIPTHSVRLVLANAAVLGGGLATYTILRQFREFSPSAITAAAAAFIAGGLMAAMLFEGSFQRLMSPSRERLATLSTQLLVAVVLYLGLHAYADGVLWTKANADDWVAHAANGIALGIILHVAIGRRWPLVPGPDYFSGSLLKSESSAQRQHFRAENQPRFSAAASQPVAWETRRCPFQQTTVRWRNRPAGM